MSSYKIIKWISFLAGLCWVLVNPVTNDDIFVDQLYNLAAICSD